MTFGVLFGIAMSDAGAHQSTRIAALAKLAPVHAAVTASQPNSIEESFTSLAIYVRDAASKQLVPANIRIFLKDSNKFWQVEDPRNSVALYRTQEWYTLEPGVRLKLPREQIRIEASRGIEWSVATAELDLQDASVSEAELVISQFNDIEATGWLSGNTHLHMQQVNLEYADRYIKTVSEADQIRFLYVSYLERLNDDAGYVTNQYRPEDLRRLEQEYPDLKLGWGEELRHNFGQFGEGYGHVLLLGLKELIKPVSIGPSLMGEEVTDGQPLKPGIEESARMNGTAIWAHNDFGMEDVPNWISNRLDALNIFDGGDHTHYENSFYRFLNLGLEVPFSTGTDWFMFDFMRVYAQPDGSPSIDNWMKALKAGKSFITNGPLISFSVEGRQIGDTIKATAGDVVTVSASARGRADFKRIELIFNGRLVHAVRTRESDGRFGAQMEFPLELTEPGWLAVRVPWDNNKNLFGHVLRGHTSAIYVELNGQRHFDANTARGMIHEMRADMELISEKGRFANAQEQQSVLSVYQEAIATLEQKLDSSDSE